MIQYTLFYKQHFYKQHFYKQHTRLKLAKNQTNAKQHPKAELLIFTLTINYELFFSHVIIQK